MKTVTRLIKKVLETQRLSKQEIVRLLWAKDTEKAELTAAADTRRRTVFGDGVHLRGLIEFSNQCGQRCTYCGLQAGNGILSRYTMTAAEILAAAATAHDLGYRTIVLQSGQHPDMPAAKLAQLINRIKKQWPDMALTLSIGERSLEHYRRFRTAGADRYLLKQETTNERLYRQLHPQSDYNNRLQCAWNLQALGYQLGSGHMVGLPGQTAEDIADDLLFFQALNADMVGIGPFIPHPATPLADAPRPDLALVEKTVALARLLLPRSHLPATTSVESLAPQGRKAVLQAGANVVMPNVTPLCYRRDYQLYPGKAGVEQAARRLQESVETELKSIGRFSAPGRGDAPGALATIGGMPHEL